MALPSYGGLGLLVGAKRRAVGLWSVAVAGMIDMAEETVL